MLLRSKLCSVNEGAIVNKYMSGICAFLLMAGTATAAAATTAAGAPPSDQSIKELLEITNAHQLIDGMKAQINTLVTASIREAMRGRPMTPERQAVVDRMQARMTDAATQALDWDVLLPIYLRTYRASFTQAELNGMISFYKTPAGQAVIKKLPVVMQNVMGEMQGIIKPMQQSIAVIQKETLQDLENLPDQ
jgi:uncharacterized protein